MQVGALVFFVASGIVEFLPVVPPAVDAVFAQDAGGASDVGDEILVEGNGGVELDAAAIAASGEEV